MPRSCVQIRFHFVFEFGFMDGSSFEPCLDIWSHMLRCCVQIRFEHAPNAVVCPRMAMQAAKLRGSGPVSAQVSPQTIFSF